MVTYVLGCHELEAFIHDLAVRYDMEIIDVVTLLHSFRVHATGPFKQPFVVPNPDDPSVDFRNAWLDAQRDLSLCTQILRSNPSMSEIIDTELNTYRWLRFLSVRDPDPVNRIKCRREADAMAEAWTVWREKAASLNTRNAAIVLERLVP